MPKLENEPNLDLRELLEEETIEPEREEFSGQQERGNSEKVKNLEEELERMTEEMKSRAEEIKSGAQKEIEAISAKSGLSPDELNEAKKNSGTESAFDGLRQKVTDIMERFSEKISRSKKSLKKLAVVASAVVALGASVGDTGKAYADIGGENQGYGQSVERKESVGAPQLLMEMIKDVGAEKIINSPEFQNVRNYEQLFELYKQPFDEDMQMSATMAYKYWEFMAKNSEESLRAQYPSNMDTIYQQAGFASNNAFVKYLSAKLENNPQMSTEEINSFVDGFGAVSEIYGKSNKYIDKQNSVDSEGGIHKTYTGIIGANYSLSKLTDMVLARGDKDLDIVGKANDITRSNIDCLKKINADAVKLGDGNIFFPDINNMAYYLEDYVKFLIPNSDDAKKFIESWKSNDRGGVMMFGEELASYLNGAGKNDSRLAKIAVTYGLVDQFEAGGQITYRAKAEVPNILMTNAKAYVHEVKHYEFVKNNEMIRKWVDVLNGYDIEMKKVLIDKDLGYMQFDQQARQEILDGSVSADEIIEIINKQIRGEETTQREMHLYTGVQEFFAEYVEQMSSQGSEKSNEVSENMVVNENVENLRQGQEMQLQEVTSEQLRNDPEGAVSIARNNVLNLIGSETYLKMIQKECGCSEAEAREMQKNRLDRVSKVKTEIIPIRDLNTMLELSKEGFSFSEIKEMVRNGAYRESTGLEASAFAYDGKGKEGGIEREIYFSDELFGYEPKTALSKMEHEFAHTVAKFRLGEQTSEAKELMSNSSANLTGRSDFDYLSDIEEINARFKNVQLDATRLGIWKYGTPFTKDHYDALIKRHNAGGLSAETSAFLESTDPYKFIEMINKIAEEQQKEKDKNEAVA